MSVLSRQRLKPGTDTSRGEMAIQKGDSQMATNSLTALITGGTSGIGRATAKQLAKLGIHVLVVGRNAKRADETLAEMRGAGGKADFISSGL